MKSITLPVILITISLTIMAPGLCRGGGGAGGGFGGAGFGGHGGGVSSSGHAGATGIMAGRGGYFDHHPYGYGFGYGYGGLGYGYGYGNNLDPGYVDQIEKEGKSYDQGQRKQIERLQSLPNSAFVKNYSWPSTTTAVNGQPPAKRPSVSTRQLAAKHSTAQQHSSARTAPTM